ncbi:hypothetical protein JX266_004541 [Neoarthrinium moseri]|nr:hypothetical protein JX266_004541 [Neoarthrinium moseri]
MIAEMTADTSLKRCEALVALLGAEKVSLQGSTAYNTSLSSYWAAQASATHPICFVSPQTSREVSAVVGSLVANGSIDSPHSSLFAIRSGGHMWIPGSSNAPGGVTIDLRSLNSIKLHPDKSIVSLGVGATWDAVYAELDPLGLSVTGGRIAGVGVGGLTLGGGISYFGPRHGWTCDTATAFEVVLADGSVIEANEEQNTDLFRGLRGGSNNFGLVTRIDLKTFEQGLLWTGTVYHPLSTIDDHAKIFANMTRADNYDEDASFIVGFGYSQERDLIVINNELIYTKPVESPTYYQELLDLPSIMKTSSIVNTTTLSQQGAAQVPPGARYLFATTTFLPTEPMLHAVFKAWNDSLEDVKNITGLTWSLSLEPLPPGIYKRDAEANAMGLGDRIGTRVVVLMTQRWSDEADDENVHTATRSVVSNIEEAARALDAYDPFLYLNYAASWQNPIASYGNASVQQLQSVRARVDPQGVFTHLAPGGFKIPS